MTEQDVDRTGEEKTISDDLKQVDQDVGQNIDDNPQGNRDDVRRSKFVDLHGDEDDDPNTSEAQYQGN